MLIGGVKKKVDKYVEKWGANHEKMKELRAEANKLVSKTNKRIRRLEKNGFSDLPSLKDLRNDSTGGLQQFSVKGQTYNQLQQTIAKMKRFEQSKTSTLRGVKDWLLNVKKSTTKDGILKPKDKRKSTKKLYAEGKRYFGVYNKMIEYGKTIENGIPPYVYYKQIFKEIETYMDDLNTDLSDMSDEQLQGLEMNIQQYINTLNREIEIDDDVEKNSVKEGGYHFLV